MIQTRYQKSTLKPTQNPNNQITNPPNLCSQSQSHCQQSQSCGTDWQSCGTDSQTSCPNKQSSQGWEANKRKKKTNLIGGSAS